MIKFGNKFFAYILFGCIFLYTNIAYSKTYLITCATSGLGKAISKDLANQGNTLILTARNMDKLKELRTTLDQSNHQKHHIVNLDFEDSDSIIKVVSDLGQVKLDGIVLIRPRMDIPSKVLLNGAEWNKLIDITYSGPMELIYRIHQRLNNPASIVVINGLSSNMYMKDYGNSSVASNMWKASVKNLSYILAKDQVRVNAISPYIILTDYNIKELEIQAQKHKTTYQKQLQKDVRDIPSARYGEPSDVTNLVKFLLSNESTYINGSNIILDGGYSKAY